jgi:hypothetical protein
MGKEGINILNDVVYITYTIMGSIEGKSRETYAPTSLFNLLKKGKYGVCFPPGMP